MIGHYIGTEWIVNRGLHRDFFLPSAFESISITDHQGDMDQPLVQMFAMGQVIIMAAHAFTMVR